jgi:hypothetical protein
MRRYINTDNIRITANTVKDENGEVFVSLTDVRKAIEQTPTADVVEVVRCEDCRHYHAEKGGWCERHDFEFDVRDYCCHGEKK